MSLMIMEDSLSHDRQLRRANDRRLMQESARFMEELAHYQNQEHEEKHVYESVLSPLNPQTTNGACGGG